MDWLKSFNVELLAAVTLAFTALAALAGVFAAAGALRQVRRVKDGTAAQVFLDFSDRYNSEEMAQAMRDLVAWYREQGPEFAENWNRLYEAGDERAKELNKARRRVSRYFDDVGRLYAVGLLSKRLARSLLSNYGIQVFYDICEPMSDARMPARMRKFSNLVRWLMPSYGVKRIVL